MAVSDRYLPKDAENKPVDGFYNSSADEIQARRGSSGAARVRVADGDDVALGARTDAQSSGALSGSFSLISLAKEMVDQLRTQNS